jgi:hypothetical protein
MKSVVRIRHWPHRNFLAELDPNLREVDAIEDLAHRDPNLRKAYRSLRHWSRKIRSQVPTDHWVSFADARGLVQTTEFELAFNLGFEAGHLARRAGLSPRPGTKSGTDLAALATLQRLLQQRKAPRGIALLLLRLASALLEPEPPGPIGARVTRKSPPGRTGQRNLSDRLP